MLAVEAITTDGDLRRRITRALRSFYIGSEGLAAELGDREWLRVGARRNLGKANGMLGLLVELRTLAGPDPDLERHIAAGTAHLSDPERAASYAVMLPPYLRGSEKTIICTAFAGLSLATVAQPGILFPTPAAGE
jgi:hypothetical protein